MTFKKTIIFIAAITAAILVPLGLIAGAVTATTNYSEYQITSTPEAKIEVSDITSSNAHIYCSIDRSNMVIDASSDYTKVTQTSTTKYVYTSDYEVYLIDMTKYNNAVKKAGNEVVNLRSYILHTIKIRDNVLFYDGMEVSGALQSFVISDIYLLTADTVFQEGTEYYTLEGADYVLADIKYGTEVEKGMYYVKVKNTSFDFYIGNLSAQWDYAMAIQFYYSTNDMANNSYNNGLTSKTEFTTK